eukprot:g6310.t1
MAIDTVASLDVTKYVGRWYQLYGNEYTSRITRDNPCVAADYGLDQATGNITVINSSRIRTPTGELNTISGYAYGKDPSEPGQLKVHLGQVPVDGDYWVVGLGPDTFGPDGAYEWALVSGPEAESLFVLVRDVPEFEEKFAGDVLDFVKELGFTGQAKEPQRIVQEGCLPFDPSQKAQKLDWYDVLATMGSEEEGEAQDANGQAVEEGDDVARAAKKNWLDALETLQKSEEYAQALKQAGDVDGAADAKDWFDVLATLNLDDATHVANDEEFHKGGGWADFLSKLQQPGGEEGAWGLIPTVDALDVNRFTGRWYQSYSSASASALIEQQGACVTADYSVKDDRIRVVNTARAFNTKGEVIKVKGYAEATDLSKPGQLTLHLDGTPDIFGAPYWIVALGDEDGHGPYPWAIISDPLRAFLFVLVRDPEDFSGSKAEKKVLKKCEKLGFTASWNSPRKTVQEGCSYTTNPAEAEAEAGAVEVAGGGALSSVLELRGGALGLGGPLHASCKMTMVFPKNFCDEVSGALVSAAEGMTGFDNCNGGNKCGYTVSKVANGSVKLVHETSVKHYKDDLTFTLNDTKGGSCEAQAFSTSQTWYAVLDNSVNYCNLHNLVDACGLEYTEKDVSDSTTVWAHMDPYKRKRLNLEDFEDRLNIPPLPTNDNIVQDFIVRLRSTTAETSGTGSEQAKRLFRALDLNKTGEMTFTEMWASALQLGIVRSNFVNSRSSRRYLFAERLLGCIPISWRIRQHAARLATDHRFGGFILASIVLNSVLMAFEDYKDPGKLSGNPSTRNQVVIFSDTFFLGVFTFEAFVKIVAMGLVGNERCYLREGWNRLDMVVVCSGLAAYIPGMPGASLSVLRTFRILRPLRSLRATPTLRQIVEALLGSIAGIINVLVLQTMFFVLFAVLGLQLWAGQTLYQCRETALPTENGTWETYANDPRVCSTGSGGLFHCDMNVETMDQYPFCASPSDVPSGTSWEKPRWGPPELNYGITSFDNIAVSLLTVFQCVTMEGWVGIMYMYRDGFNSTFSSLYFVGLVVFGALFMINLFFAVMWEQFSSIADIQSRKVNPDDPETFQKFGAKTGSGPASQTSTVTPLELVDTQSTPDTPRSLGTTDLRQMARALIESHVFQATIVLCIVFNTFLLCLDSYPEDPDLVHVTEVANFYLTLTFAAEMTLKIWALGPRAYSTDRFNVFDGVIVLFSLLELLLSAVGSVESLGGVVSSLRFFRLLRVLKLAKSWKSMRRIITTAGDSLHEMGHIIVLLALFIYIFALVGMKLYSGKFWFEEDGVAAPWDEVTKLNSTERLLAGISQPRVNFDSFASSLLACFIIITGEDWNQVMYDGIRGGGSFWYSTFFVACVGLGQFVVLNLFLAVLLGNIDMIGTEGARDGQNLSQRIIGGGWNRLRQAQRILWRWPRSTARPPKEPDVVQVRPCRDPQVDDGNGKGNTGDEQELRGADPAIEEQRGSNDAVGVIGRKGRDTDAGHKGWQYRFCCGETRDGCRRFVRHHYFEVGTMVLIFASSMTLILQSPLDDPSKAKATVLTGIDLAVTFLFCCEMILKIFAMGTAYFRDEWNLMDGSIVVTTVTADVLGLLSVRGNALSSLRVLRALRALRPLRLIPRAPGLKRVVNAMICGLPPVLNVAVVVLVFFLIFSILGVRLFKGTFVGCDFSGLSTTAVVTAMSDFGLSRETYVKPFREPDCLAVGGVWGATVDQNFDNVGSGLLSLFEIATTEGWVRVMLAGVDAVGIGINPVEGWNSWMVFFFVGVIVVGNL